MSNCEHTDLSHRGLSGGPLTEALEVAQTRCTAAGERLTAPRRRVLELLLQTGQPAKAYDLIAIYGENGVAAKPPTVYRALDFLVRQGLAHRIESLNAYVACHMGDRTHVAAFLICTCCGDTLEIEPFEPERTKAAAHRAGYELRDVVVEGRGLCAACARGRAAA
jgi:Fur family transcriptional regulator, zinc uptake regulator